ncbi:chemotaxis protein CheW [Acidisoma sp. S159]|uniref:chemotaxis protein CheW n=1 Tax=Acidisoma sp. S159 TaxID=1747225 RepID=UPI00131AD371|nr:chemotaxis protein CheW [Acidisoma sp. S159]
MSDGSASFLMLAVGSATLALALTDIAEVLPTPRLAPVTSMPFVVRGVFMLGGKSKVVIDLARLLDLAEIDQNGLFHHHILLPRNAEDVADAAILVRRATGTRTGVICPQPEEESFNGCVAANVSFGDDLIPLLSLARLLTALERQRLGEFSQRAAARASGWPSALDESADEG